MTFDRHDPGTPSGHWHQDPHRPRARDAREVLRSVSRLVVVAAHPDDETLGAGGLTSTAVALGERVDLVVLTDGEGSHPDSTTCTPEELGGRRRDEARAAAAALGCADGPRLIGLPDGGLAGEREEQVTRVLVEVLGDARETLVVAPWRHDRHPDHEAAGRSAAAATVRTGAALLEYPVWFWHWGRPSDAPWQDMVVIAHDEQARSRKVEAIAAHRSQVAPLSEAAGDEVLLGRDFLAHFTSGQEVFLAQVATDETLEALHARTPDPWQVRTRWYERRKRALLLAALPRPQFARGLEVGCSRGELSAALATRCHALVAVDRSPTAIDLARDDVPENVQLAVLDAPDEWPEGSFDLVVLSEVGYFLSPMALEALLERVAHSLRQGGVVALCHWLHPILGWPLDGADVHERALATPGLPPPAARYRDADVELLVLAQDGDMPEPHE